MKPRRFYIPPTKDQGSTYIWVMRPDYLNTWRQTVLQRYNFMRALDGQPPLSRLPKGTKVVKQIELN